MATLFAATLELSKILQNTVEGTATAGTTDGITDVKRPEYADYFDDGTIWILDGANANVSASIKDWIPTLFTFTLPLGAGAIAPDTRYAAAPADYPRHVLIQAINQALAEMRTLRHNTALTTVADQEDYDLPAGVYNLRRVEIAENLTAPYEYTPHYNWRELTVGTVETVETPVDLADHKLRFDVSHVPELDGYIIRLTYAPDVAAVTADTDTISEVINQDRLKWLAATYALRWKIGTLGGDQPDKSARLSEAIVNAERMAGRYTGPSTQPDPHLAGW